MRSNSRNAGGELTKRLLCRPVPPLEDTFGLAALTDGLAVLHEVVPGCHPVTGQSAGDVAERLSRQRVAEIHLNVLSGITAPSRCCLLEESRAVPSPALGASPQLGIGESENADGQGGQTHCDRPFPGNPVTIRVLACRSA